MKKSERMFNALVQAGVTGYSIPIMEIGTVTDHARVKLREGTPPALIPAAVAEFCERNGWK